MVIFVGGLILQSPKDVPPPLQFAATASFLSKLYSDYLEALVRSGGNCVDDTFSIQMLRIFSTSQASFKNLKLIFQFHGFILVKIFKLVNAHII